MPFRSAGILVLFAFAGWVGFIGTALAQDETAAASPDSVVENDQSWFNRTIHRYFGNTPSTGESLEGQAVELVDRYARHAGKLIEVVLVYQVARFDEEWVEGQGMSQALMTRATQPLQSYTKDHLIREYLLFQQGEKVDPFRMADSERMLRDLEFINDVRIVLVPMEGDLESVVAVVEIQDRWPFGATGVIKDVDWYEGSLYSTNVGGVGVRFDNKILYRKDRSPELGYRGILAKRNLGGTFIDMGLEYEDSWRELKRQAVINRALIHPAIKIVGGVGFQNTRDRNNEGVPEAFTRFDTWVGRNIRLNPRMGVHETARAVLVPAVRYIDVDFYDRPETRPDTNQAYHDTRNYLGGLTLQRLKDYKISYLFGMGEAENIPSGIVLKVTGGYQEREYYDRTSLAFQAVGTSVRNRGDVFSGRFDFGGYYHDGVFEDGSLLGQAWYISSLMGQGGLRHRFFSRVEYARAINWTGSGGVYLRDDTGLRAYEGRNIQGDQRLTLNLESRFFTPWSVLGFHIMIFAFADVGVVADEEDDLFTKKFYPSIGLGVRIKNPDLVVTPVQLRFAFLRSVETDNIFVGIKLGNVDSVVLRYPGVQPAGVTVR